MPCEHYKDAIVEAAASGTEPRGELRAHLRACTVCRAALAAEESLFVTIDASVCQIANAEVSASLLSGISRRVGEETLPSKGWRPFWAAASALLVASVVFVLHFSQRFGPRVATDSAARIVEARPSIPRADKQPSSMLPDKPLPMRSVRLPRTEPQITLARVKGPEVLVLPRGEAALARYAALLGKSAILEQVRFQEKPIAVEPLEIAEIDVGQLSISSVPSKEVESAN